MVIYNLKSEKNNKKILKAICVSTFALGIMFSRKTFATEFEAMISDEYKEWINLPTEERLESFMPQTVFGEVPEEILEEYNFTTETPRVISLLLGNTKNNLENVAATITQPNYSLNSRLDLRVENQGTTTECWAFSALKSLETNIAISNNTRDLKNFSERHMDYSTTRTFTDGVNPIAYNRELGNGGLPVVANGYLVNGTGAVLEENMPFEDNENKISISEIDKKVDTIVTDYITLPTINKQYTKDEKGNTVSVKYTDASGKEYTQDALKAARNIIKEHLVTKGAITSITAANQSKYYDINNIFKATAYNCNSTSERRDHAITIVGWDDNYSKRNFKDGCRPSQDGAYLVLNSYGSENFDHGYMYISYEDFFIESEIYGIQSSSKVDYDKIYQHDFYGGIFQVTAKGISTGYYGATFKRDNSKNDLLNDVGVTLSKYSKIEIYVNPTGTDMKLDDMIKIGESQGVLAPGYHRIKVKQTELTSDEFAIVVKQYNQNGDFSFQVEAKVSGTAFGNVSSENRSYFSSNGNSWRKLSALSVGGIDMSTADVCIKAFTNEKEKPTEKPPVEDPEDPPVTPPVEDPEDPPVTPPVEDPEDPPVTPPVEDPEDPPVTPPVEDPEDPPVTPPVEDPEDPPVTPPVEDPEDPPENPPVEDIFKSSEYVIKDEYIFNITHETTKSKFIKNITTNLKMKIFTEDDKEVSKDNDLIKTGMKLNLSNGKTYNLIVRGDINKDGKVTLTDISKLILHYNESKAFILKDPYSLKACDMNFDGEITLTDISQLIIFYNHI